MEDSGDINFEANYLDNAGPEQNIFDTCDLCGNETEDELSDSESDCEDDASMEDSNSDKKRLDNGGDMLVDNEDEEITIKSSKTNQVLVLRGHCMAWL